MKTMNNTKIIGIGIDHGYGNMKTANCWFPTGVLKSNTEPVFTLRFEGRNEEICNQYKKAMLDELERICKEMKA